MGLQSHGTTRELFGHQHGKVQIGIGPGERNWDLGTKLMHLSQKSCEIFVLLFPWRSLPSQR